MLDPAATCVTPDRPETSTGVSERGGGAVAQLAVGVGPESPGAPVGAQHHRVRRRRWPGGSGRRTPPSGLEALVVPSLPNWPEEFKPKP